MKWDENFRYFYNARNKIISEIIIKISVFCYSVTAVCVLRIIIAALFQAFEVGCLDFSTNNQKWRMENQDIFY